LLIVPRDKADKLFHKEAEPLLHDTLSISWFDFNIIKEFLKYMSIHPVSFFSIVRDVVLKARNAKIAFKNLTILPKGIYVSTILQQGSVSHIHAHWASTTSTMAYIISKITGIPWSFTAHRWDISENNILKEKIKTASFVRVISEQGKKEVLEIIGDASLAKKIRVIHAGVVMPEYKKSVLNVSDIFTFLCPANFVYVKGHRYLFEACRILLDKGFKFMCLVAGCGPLEDELKRIVKNLGLGECVVFLGRLPHEELIALYEQCSINAVILPSIVTDTGDKEGIPVALMEAMSYGIPVISTNTGGIPELFGDGGGIMVKEKNSEVIAGAIEKLIMDMAYCDLISKRAREKVEKDFNISLISQKLLHLFSCGSLC